MTAVKREDALLESIGSTESLIVSYEELEEAARKKLTSGAFGYIRSGAGREETLQKNTLSFSKYSVVPRFLNDVSILDTRVKLFGKTYPYPILLAPVGMLKLADEQADIAAAKAAAKYGIPFIQSTVSSYSIEEIARETGNSPKWFQLYWSNHEEISLNMVRRAEEAGYEAIVLTVDTVMLGWREEDLRNRFSPLKLGYGKANYETDSAFLSTLSDHQHDTIIQGILDNIFHPHLTWKQVSKLKQHTNLPILLKGILHPDDALLAIEHGVDGIIVSNHGGRQLDGVIASVDALPAIIDAVDGRVPILFDSGIRRGSDIVKALALGASAVLIGRPFVYSLAVGGQRGVELLLERLIQETNVSISLAGAASIEELHRLQIVYHR
ncbi:alpha-hydroxy-acid oxidizing enzyme [Anoxybacillus sp. UARK-01]|uniref:alpha-hydroxy-acid oxidizing protein n=1 Tax=Anoxybacillus sp. UARK-01 TaxID=1895648 RepID=UPI0009B9DC1D|nr:alpha-hydroxy-acid oxidizing protein [Anoxybacillus sp. UARK-01]OQM45937.1 alpha-hydroxy-acid oxidizing enzyme [Anoxybacillus sp. UARK-01]